MMVMMAQMIRIVTQMFRIMTQMIVMKQNLLDNDGDDDQHHHDTDY